MSGRVAEQLLNAVLTTILRLTENSHTLVEAFLAWARSLCSAMRTKEVSTHTQHAATLLLARYAGEDELRTSRRLISVYKTRSRRKTM